MKLRPWLLLPFVTLFGCETLEDILFLAPGGDSSKAFHRQEGVLIIVDGSEPDSGRGLAKNFPLGGSITERSLNASGDEDWVFFSESVNATRNLYGYIFGDGPLVNVSFEVYKDAEIFPFATGNFPRPSAFSFSTTSGSDYYIKFKANDGVIGCYAFKIY